MHTTWTGYPLFSVRTVVCENGQSQNLAVNYICRKAEYTSPISNPAPLEHIDQRDILPIGVIHHLVHKVVQSIARREVESKNVSPV